VIKFVNFIFALFTPPLGDFQMEEWFYVRNDLKAREDIEED
jgi:hypothetical protein